MFGGFFTKKEWQQLFGGKYMKEKIEIIKDGIIRIRLTADNAFKETLLTKYGFLKEEECRSNASLKACETEAEFDIQNNKVHICRKNRSLDFLLSGFGGSEYSNNGFRIQIPVTETERFFGLGDESRSSVMKRGRKAVIWQKNVVSYGPIPFLLSSDGWGVLINCTYKHTFDLASENKNTVTIEAPKGVIDFYVFQAESMVDVISLYTDLTGKPIMLPKFAYGLTFVNNEEEGAKDVLENSLMFRREDIPCDVMGLEPGWMETHYDYSVDKKWSTERFYLPYWLPDNYNGTWSFFYNLRQMGFKLSLWLCCDYDLLWYEEQTKLERTENSYEGAEILDDHFLGDVVMDKLTKPGEHWFEHLKKFVDQDVAGFKLDGSLQVMEHPDRLWAGKYTDDEVHNIYPLIYAKQMKKGYEEYTGKRALIYTPSLYAGTQHYAATWAGDTGGGESILGYILNMSFCGHTNASCDMDPTRPESIHFCFLMPWTQMIAWRNWHHPWFLGDELESIIRYYSKLRSSLFPYIYSMAHIAAKTGLAVVRPLSLMYPKNVQYDNVMNMYMFGDSFLVGAFDMNLILPEGRWIDYFTGEIYEGNQTLHYTPPEGKGGALFVKEGSVFVTQDAMKYIDEKTPEIYHINIYPGKDCEFTLFEDDGITYSYIDGGFAYTKIYVKDSTDDTFELSISERQGHYSIPECNTSNAFDKQETAMPGVVDFDVNIFSDKAPKSIELNGDNIDFTFDAVTKMINFPVSKEIYNLKKLTYFIKL